MSIETVISDLDSFVPSNDDSANVGRLYQILEGFRSETNREEGIPAILSLFERYPEADFGSPGPLVHELESMPGYQPFLIASLERQPSGPTVHMVNRILNSALRAPDRRSWLEILKSAGTHQLSPESVREEAREFIEYQAERSNAQQPTDHSLRSRSSAEARR
jgi:hypothetical protein